ncbi:MAG: hypothetical protein R3C26_13835 [Calditrichia bacterium]
MADKLLEIMDGRKLSAAHEARWLNLLGYCLRPGFGDPLDDWRMKQIWKLYFEELAFCQQRTGANRMVGHSGGASPVG